MAVITCIVGFMFGILITNIICNIDKGKDVYQKFNGDLYVLSYYSTKSQKIIMVRQKDEKVETYDANALYKTIEYNGQTVRIFKYIGCDEG